MFERLKRLFRSGSENIKKKENIVIKTPYKKFMKEVIPRTVTKKRNSVSKNIIQINKFKKGDPNLLKLRKTVIGFQLDFNKIDFRLFFRKKGNVIAISSFVLILILIISYSFGTRAELAKVNLYPENCLGGWNNVSLVEGKTDAKNADDFSKDNSAVLANSNAEIFCGNFSGDLPDETNIPIKFTLKLSMLVVNGLLPEKEKENEIINIDEGPIEIVPSEIVPEETTPLPPPSPGEGEIQPPAEPTTETLAPIETPATTETPPAESSEPTGLINKITPLAHAQESEVTFDEVTPQTDEEVLKKEIAEIGENDMLEVVYSLDGTTWKSLGKVNGKNWSEASFEFQDEEIKTFADISKIQVSLKPISSIDAQPVIYLDSMYIEVLYENMKIDEIGNLPKVAIDEAKTDLDIIAGNEEFSFNDMPTFTISDPDLTITEITKLVEEGKATVVEDTDKIIENRLQVDDSILNNITIFQKKEESVVENLPDLEISNSNIVEEVLNIFQNEETVIEPTSIPSTEETTPLPPPSQGGEENTPINNAPTPEAPAPDVQGEETEIISSLFFKKVFAQNAIQIVSASVVDSSGAPTDIHTSIGTTTIDGLEKSQVTIDKPEQQFKPGKYTLKITIQTDTAVFEIKKDFTWGVLVVNTNKSIYNVGDDAYIQMGVLDEGGHTICVAKLEMEIKSPSGNIKNYSTDEGSTNLIVQDSQCGPDNFVADGTPDYHTHFTNTNEVGQYDIKLKATTENGVKTINDKFFVDSSTAFDVERITASRIQPVNIYPVTLKVKSKNAWSGKIVDRVPKDFVITEPQNSLVYDEVEIVGDTKIITWNLDFEAGETKTLGYYYDAPNISPEIFLLGSLQAVFDNNEIWKESRQWQIASDAVCIAAGTGNWTAITWTNCGAGPTAADSVQIPNGFSVTLNTSPTVDSIDIQNGGTLTNDGNARTLTLDGTTGTLFTLGGTGTFTPSTYISVVMNPDAAITTTSGTISFYNLTFSPTLTASRIYTFGSGSITVTNNFDSNPNGGGSARSLTTNLGSGGLVVTNTITLQGSSSGTSTLDTISGSNYSLTFGYTNIASGSTLNSRGSNVNITGTTGTLITNTGTWTAQVSPATTTLSGNGTATVSSAGITFYNLTSSGTGTKTTTASGTTTISNLFTITAGTFSGGGTIRLNGTTGTPFPAPTGGGTFSGGSGTLQYRGNNGGGNTTIQTSSVTYGSLTLNASETFVPNGSLSISSAGTLTITNGTLDTTSGNNYGISTGFLSIANSASAILTANASTISLTGTSGTLFTRGASGIFTAGTSDVKAYCTSSCGTGVIFASAATTFYKITIDHLATIVNAGANLTTNNTAGNMLYIKNGVFNNEGRTFTPGTASTLQIDSGGTLCLGGATSATAADCDSGTAQTSGGTMPSFTTFTLDASSTVRYLSNADISISNTPTYGNLVLASRMVSTARTYTLGGAMTINGNFTITPNETSTGTPALTVNPAGTITVASGKTTTLSRNNSALAVLDLRPAATDYNLSTGLLNVATGGTLDLTSDVSATAVTLTGTSGTLFTLGGTFTITSGTPTVVVSGNGDATFNSGTPTFYNLTFTGTGVKTLGGNITINNNMTVSAGTFDPTASYTVTGSGTNSLIVNAGTIRSMHSTFAGDYISFETVTLNTNSTVDYYLGGTQTVDSTKTYYNLAISTSGTKSPDGATTATALISVNGGTLDTNTCSSCALNAGQITIAGGELRPRNSDVTISGTDGHPFTYTSGTFTYGTSNIIFTGNNSSGNTTIECDITYYAITFNASETYVLENTLTTTNTTTITLGTLDTTGSNYAITTKNIDIANSASAILTANDSVITLINVAGVSFTKGALGVFNAGTSEVIINGDASNTLTMGSVTFYDLTLSPTITSARAYTFGTGTVVIGNNFIINPSAGSALALTVNLAADLSVTGSTTITKTSSATSVLDTRPSATDYDFATNTINIATGATLDAGSSASLIVLMGTSGTLWTQNGTYITGTSSVYMYGNGSATINAGSAPTFYNLVSSGTGTKTLGSNIIVTNTLAITAGTFAGSSYTIELSGTGQVFAVVGATYSAGTSLIKITDSSSALKTFIGGGQTYNNLWFAPGAGTGTLEIIDSNTFADFKDDGTSAHSILFTEATTTTVTTFTVSGNSGQLITINSGDGAGSTSTDTHALVKSGGGVVSSDYLDIQHSVATPTTTWYAGSNSINNQGIATIGSGWYFTPPACQTIATGNWNDGSKWAGCAGVGGIPDTTDDVIISSAHTTTLDVNTPVVESIVIYGILTTSGSNFDLNSKKLTIDATGTLTANASDVTLSGTDGTPFVNSGGTFTAGTSTFIFTGNNTGGNTTIPAQAFYNLTVNNSSETFVLAGNTTMNALGTVTVTLGTLTTTGSNFSLSAGKVVIADSASAIFTANASTITLSATSGTIFDKGTNGVFNYNTSTVVMNGNGNVRLTQDNVAGVGALDFYNLNLTPAVETTNKTYTFGTIYTTIHGDLNIIPSSATGKTLTFNCDFDIVNFVGYVIVDPDKTITLDTAGSANLAFDNNSGNNVGTFSAGHIVFGSSNITVPNFSGILTGTTGTLITTGGTGVDLTTVAFDAYLDSATVTFSDENLSLYGTNINTATASTITLGGDLTTSTFLTLGCGSGNLDFDTAGYDMTLSNLVITGVNGNLVNFIANDSVVNIGSGGLIVDALDIFALSPGTSNFIIEGPLLIYGDVFFNDLNLVPDLVGGDITWATYSYPVANMLSSDTYLLATYNDFNINPQNSGGSTPYVFDITTENIFGSVGDFSIGSQDAFSSAVIHVGPDDLVGGSITIGSAGEIDGDSNDISVVTNWTNNGTFTPATSTVYFSSASNSVIAGSTTFYNLTIENTDDALAKQMDFSTAGSAIYQVDNTFTVTGNPSQLIKLWSSSSPTQWNFKPLGTAVVSYADVKDGGCETGSISIYPSTSYDGGNNDPCWVFGGIITFSIDDPTIGFGPLSSSSARFATGDLSGSNTDTTYATRMNISTVNADGFSLTYFGDLLKSGTDDINAGNITNNADGTQGTEEFGISVAVSGGSTVAAGYDHNATPASRDWNYVANTATPIVSDTVDVTNENIDVYYLANTSTVTAAGDYSTAITYIVTGTF